MLLIYLTKILTYFLENSSLVSTNSYKLLNAFEINSIISFLTSSLLQEKINSSIISKLQNSSKTKIHFLGSFSKYTINISSNKFNTFFSLGERNNILQKYNKPKEKIVKPVFI